MTSGRQCCVHRNKILLCPSVTVSAPGVWQHGQRTLPWLTIQVPRTRWVNLSAAEACAPSGAPVYLRLSNIVHRPHPGRSRSMKPRRGRTRAGLSLLIVVGSDPRFARPRMPEGRILQAKLPSQAHASIPLARRRGARIPSCRCGGAPRHENGKRTRPTTPVVYPVVYATISGILTISVRYFVPR